MGTQQYTRSRLRSWGPPRPPWITLTAVTVLLCVHLTQSMITCGPGLGTPGATVPRGDIVLEYDGGAPLEITCILDPDNRFVKSLFRNDSEPKPWPSTRIIFLKYTERVPKRYVSIINETAAQLRIPVPQAGSYFYYCTLLLDAHPHRHENDSHHNTANAHQPSTAMPGDLPSPFSTVQPTSLETSGPPPLVSHGEEMGVCLNSVVVGYKPFNITNFTCISDNWVSLTCNWTKPKNPVKTNYTLFIRLPGRPGGRNMINCPNNDDISFSNCYWDLTTTPIYRQSYEFFYLIFTGHNAFGNSSTHFRFHHYANVIPASPINITVVDKTQSSAMLRWSVGTMMTFPRDLIHKIEYKSQWDSNPEHWHSVNVTEICNSSLTSNQTNSSQIDNCRERDTGYYFFNVTDLKYAFTHYDFRIYVRSSVARGEDKWSAPGCITLKTKPTIPRRPPRTDIGSFESVASSVEKSTRDVFIYWQYINDFEKCGDSFEYRAYYTSITADNNTIIHRSNETYKNYAKFDGLSTDIGYNITIYSANKEGVSEEYSTVYVPSEHDKLDEPLSFTKMAFDERGVFELSWKNASSMQMSNGNQLNGYTIFWCESDKDRPYQCNGYMNWKHIPSSESCYNVTVMDHMKIYQFAISANSKDLPKNDFRSLYQSKTTSSGMVWASCTVLHNKIVGKIKNVWVNMINSTFMELRWKLDCSDRIGAVLGFRIFYCPVISINNSACKEPMLNKTVSGEKVQDSIGITRITDLKPYTTYMVTIALITKHGEGLHSDPLLNTTLEGEPDIKDLKINVIGLTNTTVAIQWLPPKFTNGVVRFYNVHYYLDDIGNQEQQDIIDSMDDQQLINERHVMVHDTKCRLEHLESYRSYNITVTACTALCSNRSIPIRVRTDVGLPGRISQPSLSYENTSRIVVSWLRPAKPAGPVDFYELMVVHHSGPMNSDIINTNSSSPTALASTRQLLDSPNNYMYKSESNVFHLPVTDCNSEHDLGQQTFSFAVRAVNNNPLDPEKPYTGPWSVPGSVSCVLPGFPLFLHLVIWSCLFIVLSTVSTYWGSRFWRKYKVMHNVQVVLPPTLNINFKFDHYNNFGDDVVDTSQTYYVEDGHIVYEGVRVEDGVVYDKSPGSDGRNNRSTGSANSDQLPTARWSPTTATTTITIGDEDDSSSSKQHLILPPSVPTTKSDNCSEGNNVKSTEEAVQPTEPVLPFFTMPDMPPITIKPLSADHGLHSTMITLNRGSKMKLDRNCIITHDRGHVNGCNNGYQDEGIVRNTGYQDSSIIRNNGYQDGSIGRNTGYQVGGMGRNTGYQSSSIPQNTGYQDRNIGRNNGYQDSSMIVVVNSIYNDVEKKKKNQTDGAVGIATTTVAIDCFIGDQPQMFDRILPRCDGNPTSPDKEKLPEESPLSVDIENHDEQKDETSLSSLSSMSSSSSSSSLSSSSSCQCVDDKELQEQQQEQQLQAAEQQVQPEQQTAEQPVQPQCQTAVQQVQPLPHEPEPLQLQPQPQQPAEQQTQPQPSLQPAEQQAQPQQPQQPQNRHDDGYCGKQMLMIAAAAAAGEEPQLPVSGVAYVLLDMVKSQKRLLDNIGRSQEFTKPSVAVVQPDAVPADVVQCENSVEATTA